MMSVRLNSGIISIFQMQIEAQRKLEGHRRSLDKTGKRWALSAGRAAGGRILPLCQGA